MENSADNFRLFVRYRFVLHVDLVATVLIMTAVSLLFMFSGKGTQFTGWMNDTQTNADCSLLQTRHLAESREQRDAGETVSQDDGKERLGIDD